MRYESLGRSLFGASSILAASILPSDIQNDMGAPCSIQSGNAVKACFNIDRAGI